MHGSAGSRTASRCRRSSATTAYAKLCDGPVVVDVVAVLPSSDSLEEGATAVVGAPVTAGSPVSAGSGGVVEVLPVHAETTSATAATTETPRWESTVSPYAGPVLTLLCGRGTDSLLKPKGWHAPPGRRPCPSHDRHRDDVVGETVAAWKKAQGLNVTYWQGSGEPHIMPVMGG